MTRLWGSPNISEAMAGHPYNCAVFGSHTTVGVESEMADIDRVLIVGGGIAGLSLATALNRYGFTLELCERGERWPTIGAGINLGANGVRTLRALGVGGAVEQAGA